MYLIQLSMGQAGAGYQQNVFKTRSLLAKTRIICYVAKDNLEFLVCLPLLLKCWDYRCESPQPAIAVTFKKTF